MGFSLKNWSGSSSTARSRTGHVHRRARKALLVVGTLFAGVLAQFIARGMVGGG
jgi:hypothetical protein